jgi:hypothetical protein
MGGLESQLGGMGTAFSSSLLGLAGSLVLGLLELFAGHGQNRFSRELEEWLSSITRIGVAGDGDGGDQSGLAAFADQMAVQVEQLQLLTMQSEAARAVTDARIAELASAMERLAERIEADRAQSATEKGQGSAARLLAEAQAATLERIAEGQDRLVAAMGSGEGGQADAESRMRLRSIDVQLLRILEEMSAGRQESLADLRSDIANLTAAIRQLGRSTAGR